MALSNQVFDFADFLRFSCYQILWNSDFFEETHIKTFKCSSFRSNETILVIFKHCERFFSTLIYLQSVVGFRKSQKSCSWINRDLCVPCREICLEKLFFPWCISRRFWKKKSFDSCFYCYCQSFVPQPFGNGYWKNGFKSIEASLAVYPFGPSIVIVCLLQLYLAFFRACRQGLEAAGTQGSGYIT